MEKVLKSIKKVYEINVNNFYITSTSVFSECSKFLIKTTFSKLRASRKKSEFPEIDHFRSANLSQFFRFCTLLVNHLSAGFSRFFVLNTTLKISSFFL